MGYQLYNYSMCGGCSAQNTVQQLRKSCTIVLETKVVNVYLVVSDQRKILNNVMYTRNIS